MTGVVPTVADARRLLGALRADGGDGDVEAAYARAVWASLVEPGDRVAGELIQALGPVRALEVAFGAGAGGAEVSPRDLSDGRNRWLPRRDDAERAIDLARRAGVRMLVPEDPAWPARAADLGPHAPICLWVRGEAALLGAARPAVALVGARAASAYGVHVATEFAAESAAAGVTVVSGGAYGIDAAAHRGALDAGGVTVAVMAGGVERAYPVGNRDLIETIAREGVVIAEVACGASPTRFRFLARNRLIAALSDATVVVEAGWRSGAISTANHAQEIGRPLGVVPGPITSASSMGCHRLLRGGVAQCVTSGADVRELLGLADRGAGDPAAESDAGGRTDERTRVLDALSARAARPTEDVARRAGLAVDDAAAILGLLALEGRVSRRGAGWVQGSRTATLW